jgi:hypothetical protein
MFSPPIYWRISNLTSSLTKKNSKTTVVELLELAKMYGDDSKIFMLTSLFDEIDFKDQRTAGHRDTQKVGKDHVRKTKQCKDREVFYSCRNHVGFREAI